MQIWKLHGALLENSCLYNRPPDVSTSDSMMEATFRQENSTCRQHHLPKCKQRLNLSKCIVLGMSLRELIFCFCLCRSTPGELFLLTEICQPRIGHVCLEAHPEKCSGLHWIPNTKQTCWLTNKTFYWVNYLGGLLWWIPHNT